MRRNADLVELEKCCQTHIFLQIFVLYSRERARQKHLQKFIIPSAVVADEGAELRAQPLRLRSEYALRFVARSTRTTRAKEVCLVIPGFAQVDVRVIRLGNQRSDIPT